MMPLSTNDLVCLVLSIAFVAGAILVFARVRSDYRGRGSLSPIIAFVQTAFFCLYALASYIFLDARLSHVDTGSVLFPIAVFFIGVGFVVVLVAMPSLGWGKSFQGVATGLRTTGLYRVSRNPQLVGGFLFIVGYSLLWPSWRGFLWAALWPVIAHIMVRTEEEHLERVYGEEYRAYCKRTARYFGLPKL